MGTMGAVPAGSRRRTWQRAGWLLAAILVAGRASAPGNVVAASGDYTLVDFDQIQTVPAGEGGGTPITDQFAPGMNFRPPGTGYAYAYGGPPDGIARSAPNAIEACSQSVDSCSPTFRMEFKPYVAWFEGWLGYRGSHPDVTVTATAFDEGNNAIVSMNALIPASDASQPVAIPIIVSTADAPRIRFVELSPDSNQGGAVVVDDIAYSERIQPADLAMGNLVGSVSTDRIDLQGLVSNVGLGAAGPTSVRLFLADAFRDVPVADLAPGSSLPIQASFAIPDALRGQTIPVRAIVDPDSTSGDPERGNNEAAVDVFAPAAQTAPPTPIPSVGPSATATGTQAPTPAPTPSDQGGGPVDMSSSDDSAALVGGAVVIVVVIVGGVAWQMGRGGGPAPGGAPVRYIVNIDGSDATLTVTNDTATVEISKDHVSLKIEDHAPPDHCTPAGLGQLGNPSCWYARRQLLVEPDDGKIKAVSIRALAGKELRATVVVPDVIVSRIAASASSTSPAAHDARNRAAVAIADLATDLVRDTGAVDGIEVKARVGWIKTPLRLTVYRCVSDGGGTFKELTHVPVPAGIARSVALGSIDISGAQDVPGQMRASMPPIIEALARRLAGAAR
jgi:hypothetical protein